jgi:hypothetical protein
VREHVLPDWWADEMADVEANRALAEGYIARQLGFRLSELREPGKELSFPAMSDVRFKRYKNQIDEAVKVSALLAQRIANLVSADLNSQIPDFDKSASAAEIRQGILQKSRFVDLDSLLDDCWRRGVIVMHLANTPAKAKRFDGMVCFVAQRPVIILASNRDSPAWLALHLAHEIGHLMLGHVKPDRPYLVDGELDSSANTSSHEREADRFACEILTGFEQPQISNLRQRGETFAVTAATDGPRQGIDPGVFALIYAKSNNRWAVAQKALTSLGLREGGKAAVNQPLFESLDCAKLSDGDERFLSVLTPK